MKSKMKEIEKLYAKAKSGGKGKKGGKDGKGRKGPPVDGRLRQDLKSQKRQALKKGGKGKGGKGKGKGKR